MHAHGYAWVGSATALLNEGDRRPENPERFAASEAPPMITADWLAKPPRMVRETFHKPDDAVAWLSAHYRECQPQQLHPELNTGAPPLEVRAAHALDTLTRGGDIVWCWYLTGLRLASFAVVSCPSRAPAPPPCPLGLG